MNDLSAWRIAGELKARGTPLRVRVADKVNSTSRQLKVAARQRKWVNPCMLVADEQTAGKGRLGRTFVSPRGTGLYMSIFYSGREIADPGRIAMLAAGSVCRAIEALTSFEPKIKWVNDVFVRGKKVGGILAEKIPEGVVLGVGVNISTPPGGFPPEAGIAGALDVPVDRSLLCVHIAHAFLVGMGALEDPSIYEEYCRRMPLVGQKIRYIQNGEIKDARVTGVKEDGGLMISGEDGDQVLRCGEISLGSEAFAGLE